MLGSLYVVLFYIFVFFMPFGLPKFVTRKKDQDSVFGSPARWSPDQLPTKRDVGAFFLLKKREMQITGLPIPSNRDVAKEVYPLINELRNAGLHVYDSKLYVFKSSTD